MQVMFDSKTLPATSPGLAGRHLRNLFAGRLRGRAAHRLRRFCSRGSVWRCNPHGHAALAAVDSPPESHISRFDKDYYYAGIERVGSVNILQAGSSFILCPGVGGLYYANQPYELRCDVRSRQFWIELPRHAFDTRFDSGRPPLLAHLDLRRGLGYIAMEFCGALAAQGAGLDEQTRAKLGEQFMDLLALAMSGEPDRQPADDDRSVQRARLRSVQAYMEAHLSDPSLSLSAIARKNGISLRYLHQLFRPTDMSASEWLRLRRLQRCHDILSSPGQATRSITEIAYSMGFGSSSHFSNLFRAQFGRRPSDVSAASVVSSLS